MELKKGMYVRTKKGIGRVTKCTKHESWGYIVKVLGQYSCYAHTSNGELSDVIKASNNLIDLIEVGDYVNGDLVTFISSNPQKNQKGKHRIILNDSYSLFGTYENIKSIVTKEQFESQKYIVESDD